MNPISLPPEILAKQQEQDMEDAASRQALGIPLPGPARDAFIAKGPIEVEGFKVRDFYDGDFEIMQELKHPLLEMLTKILDGENPKQTESEVIKKTLRGKHAWNLCFILTEEVEKVAEIYESGGVAAVETAAKKKFGIGAKIEPGLIAKIASIAFAKVGQSWSTMLSYGNPKEAKEGGGTATENPPQSGPQ